MDCLGYLPSNVSTAVYNAVYTATSLLTLTVLPQMSVATDTLHTLREACTRKVVDLRVTPPKLLGMGGHRCGPP